MTIRRPSFLPAELARFNPRMLLTVLPVVAFWLASRVADTEIAIISSFVASAFVFATNRHSGIIRALGLQSFLTVSVAAALGLTLNNDKVFVAENIVGDFIIVTVATASLLIGRPFYGLILREAAPRLRDVLHVRHPAFIQLTILFVAMNLVTATGRIFLIQELSAADYMVISRAFTWPLTGLFLLAVYFALTRAIREHHLATAGRQPLVA